MTNQDDTATESGLKHEVAVIFEDKAPRLRRGSWVVRELKAALGVDAVKVLAEISPQGLRDLDDGATIEVREGSRFMCHARTGSSS